MQPINILPSDGEANYHPSILSDKDGSFYFAQLINTIDWKQDTVTVFGKQYTTARKVSWYGDKPYAYTYSSTTKMALPWTKELLVLKSLVETISESNYNSCLLNLYHHGAEGMGWHSDNEAMLAPNAPIASLSLGANRKFSFKHKKSKETISLLLEHGSLLVMKGTIQSNWLHALPKTTKVRSPRINLTFRTITEA